MSLPSHLCREAHVQNQTGAREKMTKREDQVYALKRKQALQLSWKREFSGVVLVCGRIANYVLQFATVNLLE